MTRRSRARRLMHQSTDQPSYPPRISRDVARASGQQSGGSEHQLFDMSSMPVAGAIASTQRDLCADRQVVAAGGGQGTHVADGCRAGHDLVNSSQREGGWEGEGEAPFRHIQL